METFGRCGSCRFWGPHARQPYDGWGNCKRKEWYAENPLVKIENPRKTNANQERTQIITNVNYGCLEYAGLP